MKNIEVTLLWYDQRGGQGIVVDSIGNEYYIDDSVLKLEKRLLNPNLVSATGLAFLIDLNTKIPDVRCGRNVRIRNAS